MGGKEQEAVSALKKFSGGYGLLFRSKKLSLASPVRGAKSEVIIQAKQPAACLTDRRVACHLLRVIQEETGSHRS